MGQKKKTTALGMVNKINQLVDDYLYTNEIMQNAEYQVH